MDFLRKISSISESLAYSNQSYFFGDEVVGISVFGGLGRILGGGCGGIGQKSRFG